jgi:GntR family transcriptional regulator
MVSEPPSSTFRAEPKNRLGRCIALASIPPERILPETFSHGEESIFNILEEEANRKITYAVAKIEPIGYHEKISPILECEPETALLALKQMHFDEMDEPILYSVNYFRADKFSFRVLRKRF